MDIEEAKKNLKGIDIRNFLSGMSEQSNYILDRAEETNEAIETVLSELEKKEAIINEMADYMEQDIEEMKKLFYADRLTAYGKRKLIEYYEQRIKQLEEKNQLLLNSKIGVDLSFDDYIPVSLVEEKIEEIQKEYEETLKTANFKEIEKMNKINFRGITLEGQRSILRELLENRK